MVGAVEHCHETWRLPEQRIQEVHVAGELAVAPFQRQAQRVEVGVGLDQALFVPLVYQWQLDAHTQRVKGMRPNLLGKPKFEDVWLDR